MPHGSDWECDNVTPASRDGLMDGAADVFGQNADQSIGSSTSAPFEIRMERAQNEV